LSETRARWRNVVSGFGAANDLDGVLAPRQTLFSCSTFPAKQTTADQDQLGVEPEKDGSRQ
jgi:hypothetical protein